VPTGDHQSIIAPTGDNLQFIIAPMGNHQSIIAPTGNNLQFIIAPMGNKPSSRRWAIIHHCANRR